MGVLANGVDCSPEKAMLAFSGCGAPTTGHLEGRACSRNIMGIVAFGDSSLETAKANGGISTVDVVDHEDKNILLVFGEVCTLVTGSGRGSSASVR